MKGATESLDIPSQPHLNQSPILALGLKSVSEQQQVSSSTAQLPTVDAELLKDADTISEETEQSQTATMEPLIQPVGGQKEQMQVIFRLATCALSSIIAQQTLHLPQIIGTIRKKHIKILNWPSLYYLTVRRMTIFTTTLYSCKILVDQCFGCAANSNQQFKNGALAGLLSYILTKPFEATDQIKANALAQHNRNLGTWEALKINYRNRGWRGSFKHENVLGPLSYTMHRSMLFGVHYKMRRHLSGSFQDVYVFSTLMASFCATLATLPLDKLRKEYHIEYLKREGMRHHYDQPEQTLPTQQILAKLANTSLAPTRIELQNAAKSALKNWITFSLFVFFQEKCPRMADKEVTLS